MCVVAIVETARPTEDHINRMWQANPNGGGVAWREDGNVFWDKGLNLEEMQKYNADLPLPYILHFRIPSANTSHSVFACHPFPIGSEVDTRLRGKIEGFVLFHNGHWHDWRKKLEDFSCRGGWKIPSGPWSDTRALAWTAHNMGFGMLELIDEKVVVFGPNPDDLEIFGTWTRFELDKDNYMLVTNRGWEHKTVDDRCPTHYRGPNSGSTGQQSNIPGAREMAGGASHISAFRHGPSQTVIPAGLRGTQQESVQEEAAGVGGGTGQEGGSHQAEGEEDQTADAIADAVARPFGLVGDVTGPDSGGIHASKCITCGTTKGGVEEDGLRFCWHCWSEYQKNVAVGQKLCEFCWQQEAQHVLVTDGKDKDKKICGVCWHKKGCPTIIATTIQAILPIDHQGRVM